MKIKSFAASLLLRCAISAAGAAAILGITLLSACTEVETAAVEVPSVTTVSTVSTAPVARATPLLDASKPVWNGTGFSINLPQGFMTFEASDFDADAMVDGLREMMDSESAEKLGAVLRAGLSDGKTKGIAISKVLTDSGFASNVNVRIERTMLAGTPRITEQDRKQLEQMGVRYRSSDSFRTGGRTYLRLFIAVPAAGSESVSYMTVERGQLYVVTFSTSPDSTDGFFAEAERLMASFETR